jgi:hypothetical protein
LGNRPWREKPALPSCMPVYCLPVGCLQPHLPRTRPGLRHELSTHTRVGGGAGLLEAHGSAEEPPLAAAHTLLQELLQRSWHGQVVAIEARLPAIAEARRAGVRNANTVPLGRLCPHAQPGGPRTAPTPHAGGRRNTTG